VTSADLRDEIRLVQDIIDKHGCTKILSDCSGGDFKISITDAYNTAAMQKDGGWSRRYKVAVIQPQSRKGRELAKFYEVVNVNRSWNVKVFSGRQDAVEWLCSE
jgi:hypothetical protein